MNLNGVWSHVDMGSGMIVGLVLVTKKESIKEMANFLYPTNSMIGTAVRSLSITTKDLMKEQIVSSKELARIRI